MTTNVPNRSDVPVLLFMAVVYLAFGLFAILKPEALRSAMDRIADSWKEGSWHPYKMPPPVLRIVVGATGIIGAVLLVYIAYIAHSR